MTTLDQLLVRIDGDNRGLKTALQQSSAATAATSKTMASSMKQADAAIKSVDASVRKMDASMKAAGKNVVAFDRQLATASRTSGSMGVAIQQAGFQVGDFATQVASGQGVLRPFIQQGTQLVSMFGPWGAVIGAAGAVVGALAIALSDSDFAATNAAVAYEKARVGLRDLGDEAQKARDDVLEFANQQELAALKTIEMTARLADTNREIAAGRIIRAETPEEIEAARRALDALEERRKGAMLDRAGLLETIRQREEDLEEEQSRSAANHIADLREEVRLQKLSEEARRVEVALAEAQESARKENRDLTEQEREEVARLTKELVSLEKAQEDGKRAQAESRREREKAERTAESYRKALDKVITSVANENRVLQVRLTRGDKAADQLEREIAQREALGPLYDNNLDALNELNAANDNLTEALERQQEAQEDLEQAAKKAAREMERDITQATDSIVDALEGVLFDGEDIFDSLANLGKAAFREIAREAIIRPIVQPIVGGSIGGVSSGRGISVPGYAGGTVSAGGGGVLSGGSGIFDLLGGGLTEPSVLGNNFIFSELGQTLGLSSFGAGGMGPPQVTALGSSFGRLSSPAGMIGGFAGNFLGNALFGSDRGVGASIGSSVGAIAGSFIPIPGVGSFIGSLAGNFLGGLFGGDIGKPRGHTNLNLSNGRVSVGASGADNEFDPSGTQQEVAQLAQVLNAFADQLDLQIVGTTGAPAISGGDAPGPQSVQAALDGFFANAGSNLRSDSAAVNRALAQSTDMDSLATAIANINSAEDAIEALAKALNASKDPIDQIRAQFEDLRATAVQYGLDVATIDRAIQTEIDAYNEGLAQTNLGIEAAVLQQTGSALGAIQSFQLNRQLSSSATPLDRVAAAQEAVQASLEAVRGGDVNAVGGLLQNANTLLRVGADAFGTATPQFAALERMVDSQVANAADLVGNEQALQDRISAAIEAQANAATTQTEITAQMRDEIEGMRSDIRSLKAAILDQAA